MTFCWSPCRFIAAKDHVLVSVSRYFVLFIPIPVGWLCIPPPVLVGVPFLCLWQAPPANEIGAGEKPVRETRWPVCTVPSSLLLVSTGRRIHFACEEDNSQIHSGPHRGWDWNAQDGHRINFSGKSVVIGPWWRILMKGISQSIPVYHFDLFCSDFPLGMPRTIGPRYHNSRN